jgi:proteasome lid subunit RPN8/RPN11
MPQRILRSQLRSTLRDASSAARRERELCGLLVDTGHFLALVRVRNTTRRKSGFALDQERWSQIERAARTLGATVVGTWHSHVVSEARPGDGDVRGAYSGDLMLIFDTVGGIARLWRIRRGRAYPVKFGLI